MSTGDDENPYDVLGLSESATSAQIKQAYRKLALKHHPDKQTTEEARKEAHEKFSKISHAYEILGDETRRREFDLSQQQRHQQEYYDGNNNNGGGGSYYQPDFHFHDPFAVFEQVFAQEFGTAAHRGSFGGRRQPMMDPFAGVGAGFGNVFGRDPFGGFGGGGVSIFDNDPFFGGGGHHHNNNNNNMMDPFTQMRQQMDMMRQSQMDMMRQAQQGGFTNDVGNNNGMSSSSYSYSSSSSSFSGGRGVGGQRESVSTSTRIINGKRQTVTERVITKPDGTVERHVETSGDDDFPAQYAIDQDAQQQQQQRPQIEDRQSRRRRRWF